MYHNILCVLTGKLEGGKDVSLCLWYYISGIAMNLKLVHCVVLNHIYNIDFETSVQATTCNLLCTLKDTQSVYIDGEAQSTFIMPCFHCYNNKSFYCYF